MSNASPLKFFSAHSKKQLAALLKQGITMKIVKDADLTNRYEGSFYSAVLYKGDEQISQPIALSMRKWEPSNVFLGPRREQSFWQEVAEAYQVWMLAESFKTVYAEVQKESALTAEKQELGMGEQEVAF